MPKRIAFYAPLKPPTHVTPSGDRRVAGLLMDALERIADHIELVSTFRSFDADGDVARQEALRRQGEALAQRMAAQWRAAPPGLRPDLWFTYHVYYKAPDWLGPAVSAALGIPYVIAEASYAQKRASGPWAIGHDAAARSIRQARLVISPSRHDVAGLEELVAKQRVVHLPPFLDAAPYRAAAREREKHRAELSGKHALDPAVPWIAVAAMMRAGDKFASYRVLASTLRQLTDLPWRLVVAGDGSARPEIEAALESAAPGRACFLGTLAARELAELYAACDLYAWPAVNEAYGMALLEAQAAGLPVVSCATRGVPDVVIDGRTGILVKNENLLADALRELLIDAKRRAALGGNAAAFIATERSLEAAAARLKSLLGAL
ncbi:MAG TPA: glycosyltransferase family 4 protein [Burkholderiales bacterium]|nr:glycosyltransferase family 4 protein [Burkholderiales bacterium]